MNWEDPGELGIYRLKLFEYLAAQRPVLLIGGQPEDGMELLLREANAGIYAQGAANIQGVLRGFYDEYQRQGSVRYQGDVARLRQYSYREKARQLAEVLEGLG